MGLTNEPCRRIRSAFLLAVLLFGTGQNRLASAQNLLEPIPNTVPQDATTTKDSSTIFDQESQNSLDQVETPGNALPDVQQVVSDSNVQNGKVSFWDNVDVSGHVRVRAETDWERIERPTRNRGRLRARLACTWNPNEEFKAGFRWTTGDRKIVLEPEDRRGSPLSYQDMGDVFDKFELNLDRIFITYSPSCLPNSFVTAGKFQYPGKRNPIFSDPIGDLVFDEAVQPEGIAAGYTWGPGLLFDEMFLTVGETIFLEQGNGDESSMFFGQLWAKRQMGFVSLEGSVTWFDWNNLNADGSNRISFENNFGNEVIQVGPLPIDVIFASGFNILNPMLVATFDDGDPCAGYQPMQLVWETFHNSESFDSNRDSGYSLGIQYGPAVTNTAREQGDWKLYYSWNKVEQESVLTPVAQDDWLRATNFRGNWIGFDYFVRKNIELRCWVLSSQPILPIDRRSRVDLTGGSRQQEWRGRIDLTVYF